MAAAFKCLNAGLLDSKGICNSTEAYNEKLLSTDNTTVANADNS